MYITIEKIARESAVNMPDLITRSVGRKMFAKISRKIDEAGENEVIILDFNKIKVIDPSFVDELLVKIIINVMESETPKFIKLKNISEIAEINIDWVFKSYSQYNENKIAVITENICLNNSFFIGPLDNSEQEIIEFLRVNRSANEGDLATHTGLDIMELKTVMKRLNELRVVRIINGIYEAV